MDNEEEIILTAEIKRALDLMDNTNRNVFVTGKAGAGKSTLLRYFCDTTKKKIVVLAPTGVAAINVGGATLHSFFQFNFGIVEEKNIKRIFNKKEIFQNLEAIVIDEISMVRSDLMNAIDYALRVNTGNKKVPFGGVQLIMFGDLYQLPPVVREDEKAYLENTYGGVYFFNAPVFRQIYLEKVELTRNFRQEDSAFIELLNKIREKRMTQDDFNELNKRHRLYDYQNGPAITLATTNNIVDGINISKLSEIKSEEAVYDALVSGEFNEKDYPAEKAVRLKKGAQIMMIKNDNRRPRRWVNGSLGIVEDLERDCVVVNIKGERHKVEKEVWEIYEYEYDNEEKTIEKFSKGAFVQMPIKLAWAVTIHKSQGKTFDRVIIDMGRGAFAHGQTYVALSRCTSLEGIYLRTRIQYRDVIIDQAVTQFHIYE